QLDRYTWIQKFDAWIERVLSRFPDLIIANSYAGRDHAIARGFPADRFEVIHNGVDLDRFQFDRAGRDRLRREWGIAEDELLVGRVGRVDPQKDFPNFLEASALMARRNSRVRFVTVGNDRPGQEDALRLQADGL